MTPDSSAVRQQLERILGSPSFATAGRHSRLLRYLVERTLAGEGDQLKEYVLGTEVFDRADSYDPRLDSIVRVEARRLRARLDEYYEGPGAQDDVIISIPRGNYVPVFAAREREPVVAVPVPPRRASYAPATLIGGVLTIVLVFAMLALISNREPTPAQASSGVGVVVLPFAHYSTNEDEQLLVAGLTDLITAELARIGNVSVVSRTTAARYRMGAQPMREIAESLKINYVVEGSAIVTGEQMQVIVRLVDAALDRKVWVGEYNLSRTELVHVARRIATEAANAIALR